eukprot:Em0009g295a
MMIAMTRGADFGSRFKMSRHRFQDIQKVFSFAPPHNGVHTSDDPWQVIRCFIEDFNLTRKRNCIPSCHIVVDECMSSWNGADGEFVAEEMPHKTKVARKPEGVGAEMKSLACGETGILLKLDIMEGKEANQRKDYAQLYDSAFSSVKTLLALQERGLHFMGMVETEHPVCYLCTTSPVEVQSMQ